MRILLLIGVLLVLLAFSLVEESIPHHAQRRLKAAGVAMVVDPQPRDKEHFKAGGVSIRFEARDEPNVSGPEGTR